MKYEVPHPTTATRSPGSGSLLETFPAIWWARRQHPGWLAISVAVCG